MTAARRARPARLAAAAAFLAILALPAVARAQAIPPAPRDRVLDQPGVLTADERREVQRTIWAIDRETGAQIAVFIGRTIGGGDSAAYALRVFNSWGVGQADRDNGVLFLLLTDDRAVEITPGIRYETTFSAEGAGVILDSYVVPQLQAGRVGEAILAGVRHIAEAIRAREGRGGQPLTYPELPVEAGEVDLGGFGGGSPRAAAPAPPPVPRPGRSGSRTTSGSSDLNGALCFVAGCIGLVVVIHILSRLVGHPRGSWRSGHSSGWSSSSRSSGSSYRSSSGPSHHSSSSGGGCFGGGRSRGGGAGRRW